MQQIQQAIAAGGDAALFSSLLFQHADWVLDQPVVARGTPDATGVLDQVRQAIDYLLTSALAYRLNSTAGVYLDRAVAEALNLAVNWTDWNPVQHTLDTGEALFGVASAYDWLYPSLNTSTQAAILQGIVSKGLEPYRQYLPNRTTFWWVNNSINWNCVCSSGGLTGVLATYGDGGAPSWAWQEVFNPLLQGVTPCVGAYNVDSSWEEGPGYWSYASKYNVWTFRALAQTLNSTYGLTSLPGVQHAALFPLYSMGADAIRGGATLYDWADCHEGFEWTPFSQWWGSAFNDGAAAYYSRMGTRLAAHSSIRSGSAWVGFVEALVFFTPVGSEADIAALPTAKRYEYINMAVFRGPWDAPHEQQTYLGFKGGNNSWNHGHEDLGSFVYDYAGMRFAEDMGGDSYELPGYFSYPKRWSYYRMSSRGHNLLLFGNSSQTWPSAAQITLFNDTGSDAVGGLAVDGWAVLDLTAAYAASGSVSSYRRGFVSLQASTAVVIVDELVYSGTGRPDNVTWQLHTRAVPTADGAVGLTLTGSNGTTASLSLLTHPSNDCPSFTAFTVTDLPTILPDPPYDSAAGYVRVDAFITDPANPAQPCSAIRVALGDASIVASLAQGAPRVLPIAQWQTEGPLAA